MAALARTVLRIAESPRVVFLVALAIRVWMLLQLLPQKAWEYFYHYNEFARIAAAWSSGHGYSSPWAHTPLVATAVEPPVYTAILAGIFRLAGPYSYNALWMSGLLNAVFSSLSAVLLLRLGKRDFGALPGILAAWAWACWLYEAAVAVRLWESSLSALLLLIALRALPGLKIARLWQWLGFGLLAAIAGLTNTALLAVFAFFWIWLWASRRKSERSRSWLVLGSIGVCLLALLPWTIRNYQRFHRVIPVRDNFGLELWLGNHPGVGPRFDNDFPILDPTEYNRLGEIQFMESKRAIALRFMGEHPAEFLSLSAHRLVRFWAAPDPPAWATISLMAWLGMFLALKRKGADAVPYAIALIIFPVVYYATHTFNTYRHPIEPVIFLLAAYAAVSGLKRISAAGAIRETPDGI